MITAIYLALMSVVTMAAAPATQSTDTASGVETIVIVRHGEKVTTGSGQLSPQGFNRAIALSDVLLKKFGKPIALFAPDPSKQHEEKSGLEDYVRPLATIEPTAIKLGLPVTLPCGYRDSEQLVAELCKPQYANGTIFVAWEHKQIPAIAAGIVKNFEGDSKSAPAQLIPVWSKEDFDSIYIVRVTRKSDAGVSVSFTHDHEGLDDQSTQMPKPAM